VQAVLAKVANMQRYLELLQTLERFISHVQTD
jgi:hypothetical protein